MKVIILKLERKVREHTEPLNFLPLLYFYPEGVQKELAVCLSQCKGTYFYDFSCLISKILINLFSDSEPKNKFLCSII